MTRPINPPLPEDPAYREQLKRVIALGRKQNATPGGKVRNFRAKLDQMFKEHAESVLEGSYADVTGRVNPRAARPHLTDIRGSDTPPGKMSPHSRVPIQRPPQLGRQRGGMAPKVPYRNPLVPKLREGLSLEYIDWVIESALSNAGGKSWGPKTGGSSGGVTISNANGKVGASIGGVGGNLSGAVGGGFGSKGTASGRFSGASATGGRSAPPAWTGSGKGGGVGNLSTAAPKPRPSSGGTAADRKSGRVAGSVSAGIPGSSPGPTSAPGSGARHVGGPPMGTPSGGGGAQGGGNRPVGGGAGTSGNVTGAMPKGSVTPKAKAEGGNNPAMANSAKAPAPAGNKTGNVPKGSAPPAAKAGASKPGVDTAGTNLKPGYSYGAGGKSEKIMSKGDNESVARVQGARKASETTRANNLSSGTGRNALGSRSGTPVNQQRERAFQAGTGAGMGGGRGGGSGRSTSWGVSAGGSFAGGRGNVQVGARGGSSSGRGGRSSGWGGW